MCEICKNWPRTDGKPTDHHPNCQHYNDSLIDVWRVKCSTGTSYYSDSEKDAEETAASETESLGGETVSITKEKMHRELFGKLPEFDGF